MPIDRQDARRRAGASTAGLRPGRSAHAARDAADARDSPFRPRWTWRDRTYVAVAGWTIALVPRLVYATLRVSWEDPHGVLAARERGEDLVVVPDGPRGPRHETKEGVVQLARATRLAVVAIGIAAAPARRLRTWERLLVPRPFPRVTLVLGGPIPVARGESVPALAAVQAALEATAAEAAARVAGSPA